MSTDTFGCHHSGVRLAFSESPEIWRVSGSAQDGPHKDVAAPVSAGLGLRTPPPMFSLLFRGPGEGGMTIVIPRRKRLRDDPPTPAPEGALDAGDTGNSGPAAWLLSPCHNMLAV